MRIVQVSNATADEPEEGRQALAALRAGYRAAGHEPVLIAPGARDEVVAGEHGLVVRLRGPKVPRSPEQRLLLDVRTVQRVLERLRPDALEVCGRSTLAGLGSWARANGVPAVALASRRADALIDRRAPGWLPTRRLAVACAEALAGRFDTVVCTSRWSQSEFTRIGLTNTVVVPLGVDLQTYHPVRRRPRLRAALVGDADVLLVHVGRLAPERRPDLAVETLRCLRRRGVDARLVLAGGGPAEAALRAAAADLPVTFRPAPAGPAPTAALLASADLLLCPAPGEAFGLPALEALASGTPFVGTRSGAVAELLGAGEARAGRATWSHPAAFATAAAQLLAAPPAQRRLAARAAAERYPWSATVERMLALHGRGGRAPAVEPVPAVGPARG